MYDMNGFEEDVCESFDLLTLLGTNGMDRYMSSCFLSLYLPAHSQVPRQV